MKILTTLVFRVILMLTAPLYAYTVCQQGSDSDELKFVDPDGPWSNSERSYPHEGQLFIQPPEHLMLSCCATGFTNITWYYNGVEAHDPAFGFAESHQIMYVKETSQEDVNATCLLTNDHTGSSISHSFSLFIDLFSGTRSFQSRPWFVVIPDDICASVGDNVTFYAELKYDPRDHSTWRGAGCQKINFAGEPLGWRYHRNIPIFYKSRKMVRKDKTHYYINGSFIVTDESFFGRTVVITSCHESVSVNFTIYKSPCHGSVGDNPNLKLVLYNQKLALIVSLSVIGFLLFLALVLILLLVFKPELRAWCRRRLYRCFISIGASRPYDIYLLYASDDNPAVGLIAAELEQHYVLCLPERDFEIGAVMPQATLLKLESSSTILILISNQMFQPDNWANTQIKLALSTNRPIIFVRLEDLPIDEINKRPELRAVLTVEKTLDYPNSEVHEDITNFYIDLYDQLPRAKLNQTDKELNLKPL